MYFIVRKGYVAASDDYMSCKYLVSVCSSSFPMFSVVIVS